jgi:hypothetical protein
MQMIDPHTIAEFVAAARQPFPSCQTPASPACPTCAGCGQLANDGQRTPWVHYVGAHRLPHVVAVVTGGVQAVPCLDCGGTGKAIDL